MRRKSQREGEIDLSVPVPMEFTIWYEQIRWKFQIGKHSGEKGMGVKAQNGEGNAIL